jgi:hypothetical protein
MYRVRSERYTVDTVSEIARVHDPTLQIVSFRFRVRSVCVRRGLFAGQDSDAHNSSVRVRTERSLLSVGRQRRGPVTRTACWRVVSPARVRTERLL